MITVSAVLCTIVFKGTFENWKMIEQIKSAVLCHEKCCIKAAIITLTILT